MLIGIQLPSIIDDIGNYPFLQIFSYGLLICLVTIVIRIIWVFADTYWQNYFQKKNKADDNLAGNDNQDNTWKKLLVVAWTGTRGG